MTQTKPDIDVATEADWALAAERETVIAALASLARVRRQEIHIAAEKLGLSRAMIYRLLARYRESPHTSALLADRAGRKQGSLSLDKTIEEIVSRCVKSYFLTLEKPNLTALHRVVCAECQRAGLRSPSYKAIKARIKAFDVKEVVSKRFGPKAARDRFQPVFANGLRPERPLDLFQIDHTLIDVIVVDEVDRLPIGRPWLTLVTDVATRMIAGYYLSFDHPSSTSVALAIAHAVLPKEKYLRDLGVDGEWPTRGLPKIIHLDNAEEFHARALERGCQEYGIELKFRPPLRPHFGGHIERLIGTLMGAVHLLPGTTFSSIKERGDYDSQGKSVMTVDELEIWFALQVTGAYHHAFHRGLGGKPIDAWKRGFEGCQPRCPDDPMRFYLDFLPLEHRLIRRDGIQLFRIHYWDNILSPLAGRSDQPFLIRYDPRDLSKVFVKGIGGEGYAAIPYRDLARPPITLMEHRAAMKDLSTNKRLALTEENVFSTIATQRALVEQARHKTLSARRKTQRPHKEQIVEKRKADEHYASASEPVEPYKIEVWDE